MFLRVLCGSKHVLSLMLSFVVGFVHVFGVLVCACLFVVVNVVRCSCFVLALFMWGVMLVSFGLCVLFESKCLNLLARRF